MADKVGWSDWAVVAACFVTRMVSVGSAFNLAVLYDSIQASGHETIQNDTTDFSVMNVNPWNGNLKAWKICQTKLEDAGRQKWVLRRRSSA